MLYYTETNYIDHDELRTAGGKGRDDYFEVLRRAGLECIRIPTLRKRGPVGPAARIRLERELRSAWDASLADIGEGDIIVLHSPVSEKFLGYPGVIRRLRDRGCRIVNIVFDLETYFMSDYSRAAAVKHRLDGVTESALFKLADVMIVHNDKMKDKVIAAGVDPSRVVSVGVMDYLRDEAPADGSKRFTKDGPVVFCGNLLGSKSGFVYDIGDNYRIDLYGPGFDGRTSDAVRYKGVYTAFELMDIMEGSFGLVWDGSSIHTCTGACGEYLRYNNPHKMSHYLASGMPVLIWKEAALADFVLKEGCGRAIGSLSEIPGILASVTEEEYEEMKRNAGRVGSEMREGAHIMTAVRKAIRLAEEVQR